MLPKTNPSKWQFVLQFPLGTILKYVWATPTLSSTFFLISFPPHCPPASPLHSVWDLSRRLASGRGRFSGIASDARDARDARDAQSHSWTHHYWMLLHWSLLKWKWLDDTFTKNFLLLLLPPSPPSAWRCFGRFSLIVEPGLFQDSLLCVPVWKQFI